MILQGQFASVWYLSVMDFAGCGGVEAGKVLWIYFILWRSASSKDLHWSFNITSLWGERQWTSKSTMKCRGIIGSREQWYYSLVFLWSLAPLILCVFTGSKLSYMPLPLDCFWKYVSDSVTDSLWSRLPSGSMIKYYIFFVTVYAAFIFFFFCTLQFFGWNFLSILDRRSTLVVVVPGKFSVIFYYS